VGGGPFWGPRHDGQVNNLSKVTDALRRPTPYQRSGDGMQSARDTKDKDTLRRHLQREGQARQDGPISWGPSTASYVQASIGLRPPKPSNRQPDKDSDSSPTTPTMTRTKTRKTRTMTIAWRYIVRNDAELPLIAHLQRSLPHTGGAFTEWHTMPGPLNQVQTQGLPPAQQLEPSTKDDQEGHRKTNYYYQRHINRPHSPHPREAATFSVSVQKLADMTPQRPRGSQQLSRVLGGRAHFIWIRPAGSQTGQSLDRHSQWTSSGKQGMRSIVSAYDSNIFFTGMSIRMREMETG
jgi:hypothetical protein